MNINSFLGNLLYEYRSEGGVATVVFKPKPIVYIVGGLIVLFVIFKFIRR